MAKQEARAQRTAVAIVGALILTFYGLIQYLSVTGYPLQEYMWPLFYLVSGASIIAAAIYAAMVAGRRYQGPKLTAMAERENNLLKAATLFAKAFLVNCKRKSEGEAIYAINRYVGLAKTIICQATLGDDLKTLQSLKGTHSRLRANKLVNARGLTNLYYDDQISQIESLLEKALNYDLDSVVYIATDEEVIQESLKKVLSRKSELEVKDIATQLGYTPEAMQNLLEKSVEKHKLEGFLTVDGKRFLSKSHLEKLLIEKIEENDF